MSEPFYPLHMDICDECSERTLDDLCPFIACFGGVWEWISQIPCERYNEWHPYRQPSMIKPTKEEK
jgi:hypothetical protein